MTLLDRLGRLPPLRWLLRHRFPRFALVGGSGTVVNLAVLYVGHEYLFRAIAPAELRLNVALALAVFVATINNFAWNRRWTWHDRRADVRTPIVLQFAQYAVACWLGILLQFGLTTLLASHVHYLVANAIAIVIASVANFVVNDNWTFRRLRTLLRRAHDHAHVDPGSTVPEAPVAGPPPTPLR